MLESSKLEVSRGLDMAKVEKVVLRNLSFSSLLEIIFQANPELLVFKQGLKPLTVGFFCLFMYACGSSCGDLPPEKWMPSIASITFFVLDFSLKSSFYINKM